MLRSEASACLFARLYSNNIMHLLVRLDLCYCRYSNGNASHFSDRFTAQQLISSAPTGPKLVVFGKVNLGPSSRPFLSFLTLPVTLLLPFSSLFLSSSFLCLHLLFVPSHGFRLLSSSLSLPCCVRIGSDSLQKAGLQPRLLALGLQGQFEARSWWRECKYRPA